MPEESTEKQVGGSLQPDCSAEASSINITCQQCGEDCGIWQEVRDRARTPERMDNTLDIRTADAPPGSLERLVVLYRSSAHHWFGKCAHAKSARSKVRRKMNGRICLTIAAMLEADIQHNDKLSRRRSTDED
jgi:hypothetical protein